MRRTPSALGALAAAAGLLITTACTSPDSGTAAARGPVTVAAGDTTCEVSRTEADAGTIQFEITNTGSKVNEFYVYAEGDRILGEVENIGPGITRTFHVEVAEPGTYETACKPGMVGDGIRADFTVSGASAAPRTEDENLQAAVTAYQRYVGSQSDALLERTAEFVALVKAGDVEGAKELYPVARSYWERIEPVAESFGDLDPRIDGREEVSEDGMEFTGYHRLEKDLWESGLQDDSAEMADRLMADVTELVGLAKAVELNPLQLANGSKALLDEIATGKITGEEERYSHTDLYDFEANFEGSRAAIAALRPYLVEQDPELVEVIEARGDALGDLLETHRDADGFVLYTDVTAEDVRALTEALDAFAEPVATVAGVVAQS
ncbi:MAG: iron uptake system protein EfeO [Ornithinibacter sp.]